MKITLTTGGAPHYELGLVAGLVEQKVLVEVIGGDELERAPIMQNALVNFKNFQGKPDPGDSRLRKLLRVLRCYLRLMTHAAVSNSRLIHVQWPYKFVFFDRTLLNLYYKVLGKKIVFTAHNVDGEARDGTANWRSRFSLRFLYRIVDHVIVHTNKMKEELVAGFGIHADKITVIPHGVMTAVAETALTRHEARRKLGLPAGCRVMLFFGLITPYKGVEQLVAALGRLRDEGEKITLIIAGRVKECEEYWKEISALIEKLDLKNDIITELKHIPDESVEVYFKAADLLVLPYRGIFQSGVLFLTYRFGLPVVATDVGSFKEEIVPGRTGFVSRADDPIDLAKTIRAYFESDLFAHLESRRQDIRDYAGRRYSWSSIGETTARLYAKLLGQPADSCESREKFKIAI